MTRLTEKLAKLKEEMGKLAMSASGKECASKVKYRGQTQQGVASEGKTGQRLAQLSRRQL
jgi:hypothetical protein